jgi:hypothetical protein
LQEPLRIFFIKKQESEIFEKARNYLSDIAVGISKKNVQPNRTKFDGFVQWQDGNLWKTKVFHKKP